MPRYRKIPTEIRSERDLQRALSDMGLKNVEVHADPVPLDDWIGRPTEVRANVVVRRKDLGASADDMGFARNAQGTLDLIVSEIHLFRFDRKWLENLAQRTGTKLPDGGTIQFAAGTVGAPASRAPLLTPPATPRTSAPPTPGPSRSGANPSSGDGSRPSGAKSGTTGARSASERANDDQPSTTRRDMHSKPSSGGGAQTERSTSPTPAAETRGGLEMTASQRARSETTLLLQDLGRTQKLGRAGCLLYFLPVLPWLLLSLALRGAPSIAVLFGIMIPWTFVYLVTVGFVLASRFQRRVKAFQQRFPAGSDLREEAIAHLKSIARDTSNSAQQQATRVLHQLDAKVAAALKQPPPKAPHGRGPTAK